MTSHPSICGAPDLNDMYELKEIMISIAKTKVSSQHNLPIICPVESVDNDTFRQHKDLFVKTHFLKDKNDHWLYSLEVIRSLHGIELA